MSVVNVRELTALQIQEFLKTKLEPRAKFPLLVRLLEIFGGRYAPTISPRLSPSDKTDFDLLQRTFYEIQTKLLNGGAVYSAFQFPETAKIIKKYKPESQSESAFFLALKDRSYGILPFSQKVVFFYKNPNLKDLQKIESARKKALNQILGRLRVEVVEDEKGVGIPLAHSLAQKKFSEEEEIAATQFYFSAGAFFCDGQPIYFSELFALWSRNSNPFSKNHSAFLEQLTLRDWAKNAPQKTSPHFDQYVNNDFKTFLVLCSIDVLQKNTGLNFSPPCINLLKRWFEDEQIRSDLCYFTADLPFFYELNISKFNRASASLIRSLQLFFFITRNFALSPKDCEGLLTFLLHMKTRFDETEIPPFCKRRWVQPALEKAEREAFLTSWNGLVQIFDIVLASHPQIPAGSLLTDQNSSDLLFFFWQHPQRQIFIDTIRSLSSLPRFSMSLASIYEFCRTNKNALKKSMAEFFFLSYSELIQKLELKQCEMKNHQHLLFDPPFELLPAVSLFIGTAALSAVQFLDLIGPYKITEEQTFSTLLRCFILRPNSGALMFEFLKEAQTIGVSVNEKLLSEALAVDLKSFHLQIPPSRSARAQAMEFAQNIQESFHFSNQQLFFIYLELLPIVVNGDHGEIERISSVSISLISFCPFFKKDAIYFLFRYRSKIQPQEVEDLKQLYVTWIQNKDQLNRFIIDKEVFSNIVSCIEVFARKQMAICEDPAISSRFLVNCQQSLLSLFFPPLQPLTDYFRITNVTEEHGISWGEPSWKTHLGQLKPILSGAEIGVYLNWTIYRDQPVLFLSFFDWRKTVGYSAFVPINVSSKDIASEKKRKLFYGLLNCLSGQVLREEVEESPPLNAPDTPESWMQSFVGVKESLSSYDVEIARGDLSADHVGQIWEFFKNLKIAYRNRFLSTMEARPLAPFDSEKAEEIAALGHIFPSHPRGCLLPEGALIKQAHLEPYIPDAEDALILECMKRFSHPTNGFELLKFELQMPNRKYLVSYESQTADQLTGHLEPTRARNEAAPQLEATQGMYVTLRVEITKLTLRYPAEVLANEDLFRRFFDYHNLLLKANLYYLQIF